MPFYEYQCRACGAQVEVLQKISDAPLKKCPECGRSQMSKLISAPVFRLKGSGWYETDFKTDKDNKRNLVDNDKGESSEAKTETKADAAGDAKTDAKTETKSDAKTEAKPEAKAESKPKPAAKSASSTASRSARRPAAKPVKPARAKKAKPRR
jgi:putative FmdB family regulatory protein